MSWQLGIDLGTTYTAAAIYQQGKASIFPLGQKSAAIPSVVLIKEDQEILVGDAAQRRAATEPERVARGFKRRLGDETPLFLGGAPFHPEALLSELLKHVLQETEKRQGSAPEKIAISHPANWGDFKKDLLRQTIRLAGLEPEQVLLLTEPEAAAISYGCSEKMQENEKIAVYDLGGGTFDAAVLQRTPTGFKVLGKPEGIEHLGGVDFDAAVFAHVSNMIGDKLEELDPEETASVTAVGRLKRDCIEAKEALSSDVDASIPVMLPNLTTEVRITRKEFEDLCRPAIQSTIAAMHRALTSADVTAEDISKVLLVGGSSRIPLVSQMVQSDLGRPLAVDTHPKHAIAMGAAFKAGGAALLDDQPQAAIPSAPAPAPAPKVGSDGSAANATAPKPAPAPQSDTAAAASDDTKKSPDTPLRSAFPGVAIPNDPAIDRKAGAISQTHQAIPTTTDNQPAQHKKSDTPWSNDPQRSEPSVASPRKGIVSSGPAMPRGMDKTAPQPIRQPNPEKSENGKGMRTALAALLAIAAIAVGAIILTRPGSIPGVPAGSTDATNPASPEATQQTVANQEQPPTDQQPTPTRQRGNQQAPPTAGQDTTTSSSSTTTSTTEGPTTTRPETSTSARPTTTVEEE